MNDDPNANVGAVQTQALAEDVEEFSLQPDLANRQMQLGLTLRKQGDLGPEGRRRQDDRLQIKTSFAFGN